MPKNFIANGALCLLALAPAAPAQWHAVRLHPAGFERSQASTGYGTRQAGSAFSSGNRPVIWNSSASSYVALPQLGEILAMDAERLVGYAGVSGSQHAALWSAGSGFVDLNPAGAFGSHALGLGGDQQVGFADTAAGSTRASLWRGTAASWVNLHPPSALRSWAFATDGARQGGRVAVPVPPPLGSQLHAALWSGTAATFVDLNPAGASESVIYAMTPGVQAGYATLPGFLNPHAGLWFGTAASFLDLNPPGSNWSELNGTTGALHVGAAWFGPLSSACLWMSNDPADIINLHALLPSGYSLSRATAVHEQGGQIYISGYALATGGSFEAFLWTNIPAPGTIAVLLGLAPAWHRRRQPLRSTGPSDRPGAPKSYQIPKTTP